MIYLTYGLIYSSPALNIQGLPFQIELFVQQVPLAVAKNILAWPRAWLLLEVVVAGTAPGGPVVLLLFRHPVGA